MKVSLGRMLGGLGWTCAGLLLLTALLVTLVRQFLPVLGEYREDISALLSEQLGVPLEIGGLEAQWRGRWPGLSLTAVRVFADTEAGPEVRAQIGHLSVELDLPASLTHLAPVFRQAQVSELEVIWRQRDGRWLHRPGDGEGGSGLKPEAWNRILGLILIQPDVSITDVQLTLVPEQGVPRVLSAPQLRMQNSLSEHQLGGRLDLPAAGDQGAVRFAIETRTVTADLLRADYDFYLSLDELGPDLLNLEFLPFKIDALRANTEFWGRWSAGELEYLQGSLAVAEFSADTPTIPEIRDANTDFALLRLEAGYQLQLNQLSLRSAGTGLDLPQLVLEGAWRDGQLKPSRIAGSGVDLNELGTWLAQQPFVPEGLKRALEPLHPAGMLSRFSVSWPQGQDLRDFELAADLDRASSEAAWGAPQVSGVSGRLEADIRGGRLHLAASDFGLFFPDLYDRGWQYEQAKGVVRWSLEPDAVVIGSELLHLGNASVSAAGRFSMRLPFAGDEQTELTLMIGMTDSDALQTANYVPPEQVGRSLYDWLTGAIKGGRLRQGSFLLHGGTRKLENAVRPTVQMFFDVDQAQMAYQPGWPAVKAGQAFVMLRDQSLLVEVEQGTLMDSQVEHARVYLAGPDAPLRIVGHLQGDAADIHRLLLESPLRPLVGEAFSQWQLTGHAQTSLKLEIPLKGKQLPKVTVATRLEHGSLESRSLRLAFSDLRGDLHYSTAKGLRSERLDGKMLGQPVRAQISAPSTDPLRTRITLSGELPMSELAAWTDLDIVGSLTGKTRYEARLDLCKGAEDCNQLVIDSDLVGVVAPWPGFLEKSGAERRPFSLVFGLNDGVLRLNYDDRLRAVFGVSGAVQGRARLILGGVRPDLPETSGLWIGGQIERLESDQLEAFLKAQGWLGGVGGSSTSNSASLVLRALDMQVSQLDVRGMLFEHVSVHLATAPWRLDVRTPELDLNLAWPQADGQPYRLQVSSLSLPEPVPGSTPATASASLVPSEPIDLSAIPPVDVAINSLRRGSKNLGAWQFNLRPDGSRLRFDAITGRIGNFDVRGEGSWQEQPVTSTELTLRLQGNDIGDVLDAWGSGRPLTSGHAEADLQLAWLARPWQFSLEQAQGELALKLRDGRVIESGGASNILRVFGILNFNSLARRFKLDFSDLLKSGLAYDTLSGRYGFDRGTARTLEPLSLVGPSANMTMTGSLDLVAETVQQEMEVTLPLTSNIPLAAILLGAPQIAGAVFLIDKLIGDKLEKVTSIRYRVSGDWDDPEVSVMGSR